MEDAQGTAGRAARQEGGDPREVWAAAEAPVDRVSLWVTGHNPDGHTSSGSRLCSCAH